MNNLYLNTKEIEDEDELFGFIQNIIFLYQNRQIGENQKKLEGFHKYHSKQCS